MTPFVAALAIGAGLFDGVPASLHEGWTVVLRPGARAFGLADREGVFDAERRELYVHPTEAGTWSDLRRSAIAALFYAEDAEHGWSDDARWRANNAWRGFFFTALAPLPHAANRADGGYVDDRGRTSARWDFATHAARFFAPMEHERCESLSQARYFAETFDVAYEPTSRCPEFARWARLDRVAGIEVALAAPTTTTIGSMFGHLFLRVVPVGEDGPRALAESRTFSFVADTHFASRDDPLYVFKGIFGGYRARMVEAPFLKTYRLYVVDEDRDIARFALRLTADERERVLERVFTVLRAFSTDYYFFGQNCASLTIELLNGALPPERRVHHPGALGKGPTTALDGLVFARAHDGGPLVERIDGTFASFARVARDADERRRAAEVALAEVVAPEVVEHLARLHDASSVSRARAYRALTDALWDVDHPAVAELLDASVPIETALSAHANRDRDEADVEARRAGQHALLRRLIERLPPRLEAVAPEHAEALDAALAGLVARRQSDRVVAYAQLADLVDALREERAVVSAIRLAAFTASVLFGDRTRLLDADVHRRLLVVTTKGKLRDQPYVGRHRALFVAKRSLEVSEALLAAQVTRQRLRVHAVTPRAPEDRYVRAFPHAGVDILSIGATNRGLLLEGAVFDERLGDHRRHGFSSHAAFRFIAGDATWSLDGARPRVARSQFDLVRYRKIQRPPLVGGDTTDGLGFEFFAGSRTQDLGLGSQWGVRAGVGGIAPVWSADDLAMHVLFTAGIDGEWQFGRDQLPSRGLFTVPLGLEARVPLLASQSYAHDLFARVAVGPAFDFVDLRWHRRLEAASGFTLNLFDAVELPWRRTVAISWVTELRYDGSTTILGAAAPRPTVALRTGLRVD